MGKVALGSTIEQLSVNGGTFSSYGSAPGAYLAQPTNMGLFSRSQFAVVPELNLNFGVRLNPWTSIVVGYSFLYVSSVARPGDQIVLGLLESKVFDGSGTDFTRSGQDTLATVAVILRHYDHTAVTVRAFNDGVAGKGAAGPEDRAQAVAHALIVDGVPRARIFAQGYGATRRVMATGRQISVPGDRRIEIRITPLARS
jgi:flagellar motor protein MotB